jgi:FkbM family methyltransferase
VQLSFRGRAFSVPDEPSYIAGVFRDEESIRDRYWEITPGAVVVDVGCHFGSYTIPALASGAQVYALDPDVAVTEVLLRVCSQCPEWSDRLVVLHEALAEKGGPGPEFRAWLAQQAQPSMSAPLDASFSTLDALAERFQFSRLDWVKIDVEGLELSVLRGGVRSLERFGPSLLIEDHTCIYPFVADIHSTERCARLLEDLGYEVRTGIPYGSGRVGVSTTPFRTYMAASIRG